MDKSYQVNIILWGCFSKQPADFFLRMFWSYGPFQSKTRSFCYFLMFNSSITTTFLLSCHGQKKGKIMSIQTFKNKPDHLKLFLKYGQLYFVFLKLHWKFLKCPKDSSLIWVVHSDYINCIAEMGLFNCFDWKFGSSMPQVRFLIVLCLYGN